MDKFFRIPFAQSGDKAAIPDPVDADGNVSYTQGFGFDYERQKTDPAHKNIPRDLTNGLYFAITTALAELQAQGAPDFITSALNGGAPYEYAVNAVVRYADDLYVSLVAANTALPSDATKWALVPTPARIQSAFNSSAIAGGTADALTGAFTPTIAALPAAPGTLSVFVRAGGANATTTPTFKADGTAAKTIVKGNNLPLIPGDIAGAGHWLELQFDATLDKYVLQNPAYGVSTSPSASIQGAFKNLAISATGANANVSVTADEIAVEDAGNGYRTLRAVALTIAGTSVGANGLDAGALAINTWYSLWVIWNGTTTAGLMSLSATAPTMPSGYTHKARVGWMRTDGTANEYPLRFFQVGRKVRFSVGGNVAGMPRMASGALGNVSTPTWSAVAVGAFVPPTAGVICVAALNGAAGVVVMAAPNTSFGGSASVTSNPPPLLSAATANSGTYYCPADMILEGANIYYAANAAACYLYCFGYEDNI